MTTKFQPLLSLPIGSLVLLLASVAAAPRVALAQAGGHVNYLDRRGLQVLIEPAHEADSLEVSDGAMMATGLLTGALGGVGGALIGISAEGCDEFPWEGMVYGALVGEAIGVAVGVHLRDHRRGSFPLVLAGSVIAAAGTLAAADMILDDADVPGVAVAALALQLGTAVYIERRTRRPVR